MSNSALGLGGENIDSLLSGLPLLDGLQGVLRGLEDERRGWCALHHFFGEEPVVFRDQDLGSDAGISLCRQNASDNGTP